MDVIINDVSTYLEFFLVIAAVVSTVYALVRFFEKRLEVKIDGRIDGVLEEIRQATKQIQPGTNGGLSMTDLHAKVDGLRDDFDEYARQAKRERDRILRVTDENQAEWFRTLHDQGIDTPDPIKFSHLVDEE